MYQRLKLMTVGRRRTGIGCDIRPDQQRFQQAPRGRNAKPRRRIKSAITTTHRSGGANCAAHRLPARSPRMIGRDGTQDERADAEHRQRRPTEESSAVSSSFIAASARFRFDRAMLGADVGTAREKSRAQSRADEDRVDSAASDDPRPAQVSTSVLRCAGRFAERNACGWAPGHAVEIAISTSVLSRTGKDTRNRELAGSHQRVRKPLRGSGCRCRRRRLALWTRWGGGGGRQAARRGCVSAKTDRLPREIDLGPQTDRRAVVSILPAEALFEPDDWRAA